MESPEKKELLVGQCITIDINKTTPCIACNKIQPVNNEEEFVTIDYSSKCFSNKACFPNDDQTKPENFTCFNDAIQSFFALKCPTPISE